MPTPLNSLDVARKRGTFTVLTASGGCYTIIADKRFSGRVTISGGTLKLDPEEVIIGVNNTDGTASSNTTIRVGQCICTTRNRKPYLTTSEVVEIWRTDDLFEDERVAFGHEKAAPYAQQYRERMLREAPPVLMDRYKV